MKKILQLLSIAVFGVSFLGNSNAQCDTILIASTLCTNSSVLVTLGDQANTDCLPTGNVSYSWQVNQIMSGPDPAITDNNDDGTATIADLGAVTGDFAIEVDINPPGGNNTYTLIDTFTIVAGVVAEAGPAMVITCSSSQVTLNGNGSSTGGTVSYQWSAGTGGNIVSGGMSLMPVVDAAATYTLLVTDSSSGCTSTDQVVVTADSTTPTAEAGGSMEITCLAPQVTLNGTGSSTGGTIEYQWSAGAGGNIVSGGTTLMPVVDGAATYTLLVTDTSNGCTDSDQTTVTDGTSTPTAEAGGSMEITCLVPQVTLNGTGSSTGGTINYQWSAGAGGNIVSGGTTLMPVVDAAATYTLLVTDTSNGCTSTDQVIITENTATPTAEAGSSMEITCSMLQVTLNGTGSSTGGTIDYQWSAGTGGNIVSGSTSLMPVVDAAATYTLLVTDTSNGCTSTDQVIVTENTIVPTAEAGGSMEITCSMPQVTLNGTGSSTGGTIEYQWSAGAGGNIVSGSTTLMPVVDAAATYTLLVTDTSNGCTGTDQVIVTENTSATIAEAGGSMEITCSMPQVMLNGTGSSTGGTIEYQWSAGAGGNIISGGTTLMPVVDAAATYTLLVTDTSNGCTSSDQVIVTENTTVPMAEAGGSMEITCSMPQVTLNGTGSSTGGTIDYQWSAGAGGNIVSGGTTLMPVVDAAATYTLLVTDMSNGCTSTDQVIVTEDITPPTAEAGSAEEITCDMPSVTLNGSTTTVGATFSWTTTDGNIVNGENTATPTVNSAGTYTLTVTDPSNGCTATDQVVVMANNAIPSIQLTPFSPTCNGDTDGSIGVEVSGGMPNFTWEINPPSNSGGTGTSSNAQFSINNLAGGSYSVTVTDANGCSDVKTTSVVDPLALTLDLEAVDPDCNNDDNGSITATIANGSANYMWSISPPPSSGPSTGSSASNVITVNNLTAGTYTISISDGNTCMVSGMTTLNPNVPLSFTVSADDPTCNNGTDGSFSINVSNGTASYSYNWQEFGGATGNGSGQTSNPFTIGSLSAGTYAITVTDINGCSATASGQVLDNPLPLSAVVISEQGACTDETNGTYEISSISNGTGPYSYNDGQTMGNFPSTPFLVVNKSSGTYSVTITDNNMCEVIETVVVADNETPDFQITSSSGIVICPGETTMLSASQSYPAGYSYNWSGPVTGSNPTLNTNVEGNYSLLITSDKGCFSTATYTLVESDLSPLSITTDDNDNAICIGQESITLTVNNATSWVWQNNVGDPNENNIVVSPTTNTMYIAVLTNNDGCESTETVNVQANLPPVPTISNPNEFYCEGSNIILSVTEDYVGGYLWSNDETNQAISPVASFDGGNNPVYAVTVTDDNGCTGEVEEEVSIRELPTAEISTLPSPIQAGFNIEFNVINQEFDQELDCGDPGSLSYTWNFNNSGGDPVVSIPSNEDQVTYNFVEQDTIIAEISLTVVDGCGCAGNPTTSPYSVIPNGSCGASIAFPQQRCVNDILTFDALPDKGNEDGSKMFQDAYFTIQNIEIKLEDFPVLPDTITADGKTFVVHQIESIDEIGADDVIQIEFFEATSYAIRYYVDYGSCDRFTPTSNFSINALPEFDFFEVDLEACANENHVASFTIDNNDFDYQFNYMIGIEEESKLFNQISSKTITFADLPEGTTTLSFGALTDNETGCVNESYAGLDDFELIKFSPLEVSFSDSCNAELDSIFYTIEISGSTGTGNYNLTLGTDNFDLPGSEFTTGALVPGISTQFTVTDQMCNNPVYSIVEAYEAICDSCYQIQQISDDVGNDLPVNIQLCEGESFDFVFENTFEDIILNKHKVVYTIQRSAVSVYDEDEIVQVLVTEKEDVLDNRFSYSFDMDTLRTDVEYYLSAYLVLNSQTLQPLPGCNGLTPIPVRWNSNANSTISLLAEEDGVACQQEIDYQFFIVTDPADDLKQISYQWSSSGNVTFDPENHDIDINGNRSLAEFGNNPAGVLEIYLNQSYPIPGRTCTSADTLEIQISELVSPAEDTIVGFPGDLFTFPVAGLCYQWGLNEDVLQGETTQYLALQNGLGNSVLWIDVYDCNSADPDGLCVTRVYYNALEPPQLGYKPNESLEIKLVPNPNNGEFTLDFFGDQGGQLNITVVNSTGAPVLSKLIEKERRFQKESFDLVEIDAGLYFVQIIDEGGFRHVLKFVKQ